LRKLTIREGDFIETKEGLIFDVKGLVHPPERGIAFLRYYPAEDGNRERKGVRYSKVYPLRERFDLLRKQFPVYLFEDPVFGRELQGVPLERILKVYHPDDSLMNLQKLDSRDALQEDVITFAQSIAKAAKIPLTKLGISGSVQVDLHGPTSDIDLITFGQKAARAVQLALRRAHLSPDEGIVAYNLDTYQSIYNLRWIKSGIPQEIMFKIDKNKSLHGLFGGHHYFIRAVLDWDEITERYGDRAYHQIGYARARCRITDHSESIFTPCRYEIDRVRIIKGSSTQDVREVVSFRGRFCEQAKKDDEVIIQGTLEQVQTDTEKWARFVLGENPKDILIPKYYLNSNLNGG
jgi:predicted nucleotidyltransferase